jgi:transcriptional regulator with XRE-family HTH domain
MPEPRFDAARVLGDRVRAIRTTLGLSQEDIGDLAGMHWTNIGKIERGQGNPSFSTLVRLAGVLGVDPAELVGGITPDQLPERQHLLTARDLIDERRRRAKGD